MVNQQGCCLKEWTAEAWSNTLIEPIFNSGKWQAGTTKKRLVQENEQERQNEWYVETNGNMYCPNKWLHVNGNK